MARNNDWRKNRPEGHEIAVEWTPEQIAAYWAEYHRKQINGYIIVGLIALALSLLCVFGGAGAAVGGAL